VDSSEAALECAQRNATANGVRVNVQRGDAFDVLDELQRSGARFDVVILDPPAFIKRRKDIPRGQAAYRKLNQLAMRLLERDSLLVSCSCSFHLAAEELTGLIQSAAPGEPLCADSCCWRPVTRPPSAPGNPREPLSEGFFLSCNARLGAAATSLIQNR